MLVEMRTYTTHPGRLREYLALYQAEGLAIQQRILGRMVGYYSSEIGELNQVVHLWAYQDLEDRRIRREKLHETPQWLECLRKIRPMIKTMENRIMYPASFSPIRSLPLAFRND